MARSAAADGGTTGSMRHHLSTYLTVVCGVVFLAFQSARAQQTPAPLVKTSIAIDSTVLTRHKPALLTITIENISGGELELSSSGSFDLTNQSKESRTRKFEVVGDRYWGPVNISTGTPKKLTIIDPEKQKQGVIVGQVMQDSIHFAKDETKTFTVDLTKLLWSDAMHSMWPNETLFKVVQKGSYALSLSLRNKGVNLESNPLEISVK